MNTIPTITKEDELAFLNEFANISTGEDIMMSSETTVEEEFSM